MLRAPLFIGLLLFTSPLFGQTKEPIRLYLFTAPSEFVDQEFKNRRDATEDIRRQLQGKSDIQLVEPPAAADVTVEVLRRSREDDDRPSDQKNPSTLMLIKLRLSAGTYSTELTGDSKPSFTQRRSAARDAGNRVLKWVKDNRDRLIAARGK